MRPDPQIAFATVLEQGPAALPGGLLAGPRGAQLRGLKAYANTIRHARFVALEDSYARTRAAMGKAAFHAAADAFLATPPPRRRALRAIGAGFAEQLARAHERDLARAEWLFLEAHGAPDTPALDLAAIAGLTPAALLALRATVHPALRLLRLEEPSRFRWEGEAAGAARYLLFTRPEARCRHHFASAGVAALLALLERPRPMAALLERDAAATTLLVEAGGLAPATDPDGAAAAS
ncbi:putative DNA-binding domain-containing protein [Sphingomicrobium astaxanthinifaciens]|uniref:HvfC/BufC family peptide modification chaperone n=1 Tax=Sphingomicrobium astaxanthinifaciens TaxID=1227949 RepID=UPI001FCC05E8|nr:putative DNA-binding domain-containing protein [Sphingomicrobium astaxanthinifaciens]MCJ7421962.1 putative DNA-binding domain-containing protein [Sphingomicrobium astaxanthinifaciens]